MAKSNRDRLTASLDLFVAGMRPFVIREMESRHGEQALEKAHEYLDQRARSGMKVPDGPDQWDTQAIITLILSEWQYLFRMKLGQSERGMIGEVQDIRNKWAHQENFNTDDTLRALDTINRLLTAVAAANEANQVKKLHGEVMRVRIAEMARTATRQAERKATEGDPMSGLLPWREVIQPHPDVASGEFAQAEFAADLAQVCRGDAMPEYGDPKEFYRRTFLTEGLSTLLLNAIKRLAGKGGDPVIELQTNFGGGKTHSMLALYHLFGEVSASELAGVDTLMTEADVDHITPAKRAVLVGTALSVGQASIKSDGTEVKTLWGELAWQLLGKDGYAIISESDQNATNPGSDLLTKLFQEAGPCLLLIDEWVAYFRNIYGVEELPGGTFDANLSFAQSLTEAVKAAPQCLLVASLPQSNIEVGGEGGRQALVLLENTFGRLESNWRPASADESYEIVRRRLFEPIADPALAAGRDAVIRAFGLLYRRNESDFPSECKEGDYERRLEGAYPIHPELFDRLYNDWSSLEEFQRTRGVLRLMASVIHDLWMRDDRSLMILPSMIPIDDANVQKELTRYLSDNWPVIMDQDVDGSNSLPMRIDREKATFGKYSAARRVARTIYMGSAPVSERPNKGIDDRRVKLGCVQPGENIPVFGDALRQLSDQATHLYADGARYWYSTQPSVSRVARDRAAQQDLDEVYEVIRGRLQNEQRHPGMFAKVYPAPAFSGDVPDEMDSRLVILDPKKTHVNNDDSSPAMEQARDFLENRGTGPRIYRNTLVFVAGDRTRMSDLVEAVRQYMAWKSIYDNRDSMNLDPFNVKLAEKKLSDSDSTVDARIPETFQWLIVPGQPDPQGDIDWQAIRLQGAEHLAVRASQRMERDELMLKTLAGPVLRLHLDRVLWPNINHIGVRQLTEYFAQYIYLPRLSRSQLLIDAIANGVSSLSWKLDTFAYASQYDEDVGRYVGLQAGQWCTIASDAHSVVVKSDVASKQLEADATPDPDAGDDTPPDDETGGDDTDDTDTDDDTGDEEETEPAGNKRFYGRTILNSDRVGVHAGQIAENIIAHLVALEGADVTVTLEIEVNASKTISDQVVRTVSENCQTLRFDAFGFEEE